MFLHSDYIYICRRSVCVRNSMEETSTQNLLENARFFRYMGALLKVQAGLLSQFITYSMTVIQSQTTSL